MRITCFLLGVAFILTGCSKADKISEVISNQTLGHKKSKVEDSIVVDSIPEPTITLASYEECQKDSIHYSFFVLENLQGEEVLGVSDPYVAVIEARSTNDTTAIVVGVEYLEDVSWGSKQCACSLEAYYSSVGFTQFFFFSKEEKSFWRTSMLDEDEEILCNTINLQEFSYSSRVDGIMGERSLSRANRLANYRVIEYRRLIPSSLPND